MQVLLLDFQLGIWADFILVFHTPSEIRKKGTRVRYADFSTLGSKLKGTVDIN